MPKSKRARVVPTSKTKKNRKELVQRLHANVQAACDKYDYIWVFDVQNMRNSNIKDVRSQLSDSRLVYSARRNGALLLTVRAESSWARPN